MIQDKRWYFKDSDNVQAFFPPLPVDVWKDLSKQSQKKLSNWRREMIQKCKARGMKNVFAEIIKDLKEKGGGKKLLNLATEECDPYEDMVNECCSEDVPDMAFNFGRVAIPEEMSHKMDKIE